MTVKVENGQVVDLQFKIAEFKRFYTQAIRGKDIAAIPQQVARICGTCSNAHLLAAIKAIESGLGVEVSEQTKILRWLIVNGLIIRDHGLHLYVFSLPDVVGRDSLLAFDENNEYEHGLLHDAFDVKGSGNKLSIWAGGRSVHAPFPTLGGFITLPKMENLPEVIKHLQDARPKVLKLIKIFMDCPFVQEEDFSFVCLKSDTYDYLSGVIGRMNQPDIPESDYGKYLDHVVIPYSQASGYKFEDKIHMVGALARLNINKDKLNPKTKQDAAQALALFPSKNIFHNNLAQAIEILNAIDDSLEILAGFQVHEEKAVDIKPKIRETVGVGVIEAPRGTLYYKLQIDGNGKIVKGDIIVPTGQNQIAIEKSLLHFVEKNLDMEREKLSFELEKIIRAYDPCMSCASHFLKLKIERG